MPPKRVRIKPSIEQYEVTPTPTPAPCNCNSALCDACNQAWMNSMLDLPGFEALPLVPVQIHVDLPDPVHGELEAVAQANGMQVADVAHDVLLEWAGKRMADRE